MAAVVRGRRADTRSTLPANATDREPAPQITGGCSLVQSLSDFGMSIGGGGVNIFLLRSRLAKADSPPGFPANPKTHPTNPPLQVPLSSPSPQPPHPTLPTEN